MGSESRLNSVCTLTRSYPQEATQGKIHDSSKFTILFAEYNII